MKEFYIITSGKLGVYTNLLVKEQAGLERFQFFYIVLSDPLIQSFERQKRLYAAFIDQKRAFDSINYKEVWQKFKDLSIDLRFLFSMGIVYCCNLWQVRSKTNGGCIDCFSDLRRLVRDAF